MAIRQRKDRGGKWQVYWRNPYTKKQESALFATEKEAAKADALVTYKLKWEPEAFRPVEKKSEPEKTVIPTFREAVDLYITAKRFTSYYERKYRYVMVCPLSVIGEKRIDTITTRDLSDVISKLSNGRKPETVAVIAGKVFTVFRWAERNGYMETLPRFPDKPTFHRRDIVPPTISQIETLLMHSTKHMRRIIIASIHFGCRVGPSELLGIKWTDFDFDRNVLILRAACKNRHEPVREIPIKDSLLDILKEWMAEDMKMNIPWLISFRGKPIKSFWYTWTKLLDKAGFEHGQFRPYDLRHAFATEAIAAGADVGTVAKLMGHSQISTTIMHYQHVMTRQKKAAIEALPDVPCMHSQYAHSNECKLVQ